MVESNPLAFSIWGPAQFPIWDSNTLARYSSYAPPAAAPLEDDTDEVLGAYEVDVSHAVFLLSFFQKTPRPRAALVVYLDMALVYGPGGVSDMALVYGPLVP
jgi:hypothetical protein